MLSAEENKLLTEVGPGTLLGELMRQYWIPALKSDEVGEADSPPVRLKLLGEELIGFRLTSGKVGIIQNACPHRGASLFFGRNEEEGLRCVYHGWKFDETGSCVDMPSEPAESNFKSKVRARTYPTQERNGLIWAYMGPREVPPPLPDLESNLEPGGRVEKFLRDCSWLQSFEGDLDTTHIGFLHFGAYKAEDVEPGSMDYYTLKRRDPKMVVVDTEFGYTYGNYRPAEADTTYWRIAQYLYPFYAMPPTGILGERVGVIAIVPVDDTHSMRWQIFRSAANRRPFGKIGPAYQPHPEAGYLPDQGGFLGRYRLKQNAENDYMIDRELQSKGKSFTGIMGIGDQDHAMVESMGGVVDRTREHLATSDLGVIRLRRILLKSARDLRDHGVVPTGVDTPEVYKVRSGGIILPNGVDGIAITHDLQRVRAPRESIAIAPMIENHGV
ncbi:MAG TPA: Rieske 2Fe-2S domain-containing protein [Dehalococcoidia bacterium]|nr:Rieske 2Fe-2S domain-containing protein [Dehalococcoidia bacterium]